MCTVFTKNCEIIILKRVYGRVMGEKRQGAVVLLSLIHPVGHGDCITEEPVKMENDRRM